ncbi:MAG: hypothetical protein EXR75_07150, partial [Myxococcales bacterium]|nr:hypothetical protein [Myxococcales bacterium]
MSRATVAATLRHATIAATLLVLLARCDPQESAPPLTDAQGSYAAPLGSTSAATATATSTASDLPARAPDDSATREGGAPPAAPPSAPASSEPPASFPWDARKLSGPPPAGWAERTEWDGTLEAQNALL